MCLTFPMYYPRSPDGRNLDKCVSYPQFQAFSPFVQKYFPLVNHVHVGVYKHNNITISTTKLTPIAVSLTPSYDILYVD